MAPTDPTSCVLPAGRTETKTTLDFLVEVLKGAELLLKFGGLSQHLDACEFLLHVCSSVFCAEYTAQRADHSQVPGDIVCPLLDTVEEALIICPSVEYNCSVWMNTFDKRYPKCHALCHLVRESSPDGGAARFSFLDKDTLTRLGLCLWQRLSVTGSPAINLNLDDALPTPLQQSKRNEPAWEIASLARRAFQTITKCQGGTVGCSALATTEARLSLRTHCVESDNGHFVEFLFAVGQGELLWDEVCIHDVSPGCTSNEKRRGVTFAGENRQHAVSLLKKPGWQKKKPERTPHFCDLFKTPRAGANASHRINVTLESDDDVALQHRPTLRTIQRSELPRSISLDTALESAKDAPSSMAKLMLAAILGYSLFHLFGGPWLLNGALSRWNRQSIMFLERNGTIFLRPFLQYRFVDGLEHANDAVGQADETCSHRYPVLVQFAILLLEIHEWKKLQFLDEDGNLLEDDISIWAATEIAYGAAVENMPEVRFRAAIEKCLELSFGDDEADDGDSDNDIRLRRIIYDEVVIPLHDELDFAFSERFNIRDIDACAANTNLVSAPLVSPSPQTKQHENHSTLQSQIRHVAQDVSPVPSPRHDVDTTGPSVRSVPSIAEKRLPLPPKLLSSTAEPITATGKVYNVFQDIEFPAATAALTDKWFKRFKELRVRRELEKSFQSSERQRVRVAIIDTGLDTWHSCINAALVNKRIVEVRDWTGEIKGSKQDIHQHGTIVASIILDLAPHVDLYIARVTQTGEMTDIEAENVAKAIRTATDDWKCQIINLSLGFTDRIPSVERAVNYAHDKNVIIFAAASNEGANCQDVACPANSTNTIGVYSADGNGVPSGYNPVPHKLDGLQDMFCIVGENVPFTNAQGEVVRKSGTSFAAPVAVSIAACLLGLASLRSIETKMPVNTPAGMKRMFVQMGNNIRDKFVYLNALSFFERGENHIASTLRSCLE